MAKKAADHSENLSQAIRGVFDQNRNAKPKEISAQLSKKGIAVEPQYVSVILSQYRKRLGLAKSGRGRPKNASTSLELQLNDLKLVKELVRKTGSPERARQAIDAYIELTK